MNLQMFKLELLAKLGDLQAKLPLSQNCTIIFNPRMRTTLGRAYTKKFIIELNAQVFQKDTTDLAETFAHELAHLVAVELYGQAGFGHNNLWAGIMNRFGYSAERTHNNALAHALKRPQRVLYQIKCDCRVHDFKAHAYKKLLRGAKYRCKNCSKVLELPYR